LTLNYPSWTLKLLFFVTIIQSLSVLFCGASASAASNDPIEYVIRLATFTGCSGFHPLLIFALFVLSTLPLLLLLYLFLSPLFNNSVTGAIAGIALAVAAIVAAGSFLF